MTLATNICKIGEYDDSIFMHSVCDCTSDDHSRQLIVELDEDGFYISCTIYQDMFWLERNQWEVNLLKRVAFRIKNAVKYLFTGHVRISGEHLLQKEEHIRDYANALLEAVEKMKEKREAFHAKRMSTLQEGTGNSKR